MVDGSGVVAGFTKRRSCKALSSNNTFEAQEIMRSDAKVKMSGRRPSIRSPNPQLLVLARWQEVTMDGLEPVARTVGGRASRGDRGQAWMVVEKHHGQRRGQEKRRNKNKQHRFVVQEHRLRVGGAGKERSWAKDTNGDVARPRCTV